MGRPAIGAAVLSLVLAGATYAILDFRLAHERQHLAALRGELARLDSDVPGLEDFKARIREFLARKQIVEALAPWRWHGLRIVNEIVERRPPGVSLRVLTYSGGGAEVSGQAPSAQAVQGFVAGLASSGNLAPPDRLSTRTLVPSGKGRQVIEFSFHTAVVEPRVTK